jgi:transposase
MLRWKKWLPFTTGDPVMKRIRRTHSAIFKTKVAFESLKEDRTIAELSSEYKIHPNQITKWKKYFQEHMADIFTIGYGKDENDTVISSLYEEIGRLKVELDYLKKRV